LALKIAIDCDPNGIALKETILLFLQNRSDIDIEDLRYLDRFPDRAYPDAAYNLAAEIKDGRYDRGILICGTGLGMAICANKVPGVYAGCCHDVYSAERLSKSNNAQILTLGAFVIGAESAKKVAEAFVFSEFEGGKSLPKVTRIKEIEAEIMEESRRI
jgi:ribose 5-phosphate isomerase B